MDSCNLTTGWMLGGGGTISGLPICLFSPYISSGGVIDKVQQTGWLKTVNKFTVSESGG